MDDVAAWTLYVDGSCLGNQNVDASTPASWGLVVVVGDSGLGKGSGELHYEEAGSVITSPNQEGFLGAEVGSNVSVGVIDRVGIIVKGLGPGVGAQPSSIAAASISPAPSLPS